MAKSIPVNWILDLSLLVIVFAVILNGESLDRVLYVIKLLSSGVGAKVAYCAKNTSDFACPLPL